MIQGRQNVLDFFDQVNSANDNNYVHFKIFRKGQIEKGNPCIETPSQNPGWNYQNARDFLARWLGMQQFGEFTLVLNTSEKVTQRGSLRQDFSIEFNNAIQPVAGIGSPVSEADIETRVMNKVSEILEKKEREREVAELKKKNNDLEKENKELEKQANGPWTRMISGLEPYAPHILAEIGIIPKKAIQAVAGHPESEIAPDSTATGTLNKDEDEVSGNDETEIENRLKIVVEKFVTARPDDWLNILETLADAIETKPALGDKIHLIKML
jgi:hypothetical protein